MRRATLIFVLAATVVLTACSSGNTAADSPTSTPTAEAASTRVEIPDVTTQPGDVARDALEGAGFKVDLVAGDGSAIFKASNWTVDAQDPAAGSIVDAGAEVTLTVSKPDAVMIPTEATSTGLTLVWAQSACDVRGQEEFPDGFKAHWILDRIAAEIQNDQWFFKVVATVTNIAGVDSDYTVECTVAGTDEAPEITAFMAY